MILSAVSEKRKPKNMGHDAGMIASRPTAKNIAHQNPNMGTQIADNTIIFSFISNK